MSGHRLLIVSNRLPVTAGIVDGHVALTPSGGGLANGLRPYHEGADAVWVGWPGDLSRFTKLQRDATEQELRARAIAPVTLSRDLIERYYHGFANRVLWPAFHYLIDRVPVDAAGWDAYVQVNEAS